MRAERDEKSNEEDRVAIEKIEREKAEEKGSSSEKALGSPTKKSANRSLIASQRRSD